MIMLKIYSAKHTGMIRSGEKKRKTGRINFAGDDDVLIILFMDGQQLKLNATGLDILAVKGGVP